MNRLKRFLAILLCAATVMSMDGINIQAAAAEQTEANQIETELTATKSQETAQIVDTTESVDTAATDTEQTSTEQIPELWLSYLVIENSYITTPSTPYVLAGIGDGGAAIDSAVLHYKNKTTNQEYAIAADTINEEAALFYMNFPDESYAGAYEITAIDYVSEGKNATITVSDTGIDAAFGVNQQVEAASDALVVDEDEAAALEEAQGVVITDADGESLSAADVAQAINSASEGIPATEGVQATGAGNLVVVLDPGHGGTDGGASYNGLLEKNLNLAIAAACKTELETYSGVTVYMTRSTDVYLSIAERVAVAKKYGADVLVSIHNNASTNSSANGAAVYYPNSNYNAAIGTAGQNLSKKILAQLVSLGLKNNGVLIRNSESGDSYSDGSLMDYYGLIRGAKNDVGIPGIIIEHAFVSNSGDVSGYLNSAEKLKKLGVADAAGIADYYGLQKGSSDAVKLSYVKSSSSSELTIGWSAIENADGYQVYRSTTMSKGYKLVATVAGATKKSFKDSGLTAGTTYYYKVRSYKGSTEGDFSAVMSASPTLMPTITSVQSTQSGVLKVKWESVSGAVSYLLYRATSQNGTYTKLASLTTASYEDKTAEAGTTYFYKVRVADKQNGKTGYSSYSAAQSGWSIRAAALQAIASTVTGLQLTWEKVDGVYRYQLYRSTSENGTYKRIKTTSSTTYTDETASSGQTYYYKVRTVNRVNKKNGYGSYSNVRSGTQAVKATITSIEAISSTSLKLRWTKAAGATGYKIYRSTSKSGSYTLVKTITKGTTSSYTNKKLSAGESYYYKIQVVNANGEGVMSSPKKGKTVAPTTINYVQSSNSTKLKISWKKIDGASGYKVYRSTSAGGTYTLLATLSQSSASYSDKTVKAGKKYYYKIRTTVVNSSKVGVGDYSVAVSGRTAKTAAFTGAKAAATASIALTWNKVQYASGYQIYRSEKESSGYARVATITSGSTLSYTDAVPKAGTTYYYKVRTLNSNNKKTGYASYSKVISAVALAIPKIKAITLDADGQVVIKWTKVSGAAKYYLQRSESETSGYKTIEKIKSATTVTYTDQDVVTGKTYYYRVQAYNSAGGVSGFCEVKHYTLTMTTILGSTDVTVAQMVSYYNAKIKALGKSYPADIYGQEKYGTVDTIEKFAQIVYDEAKTEGVRAQVVFAQICNETGFLQFGGDVKAEQCNFAGIGATGNGVAGNTFADVTTGIRAEVQHLKAYATADKLVNACVDPRYIYVKKGSAVFVEWLGIQENPNTVFNPDGTIASGCGWATQKNYGSLILAIVRDIKKC